MSYVALATDRFDAVVRFYGEGLGLHVVDQWERPDARGLRFDLGGLRLEILDNGRKRHPLHLGEPSDRLHVVGRGRNGDRRIAGSYSKSMLGRPAS